MKKLLKKNPQKKAWVLKVRITTPRKPNSAQRKTVKVKFFNKVEAVVYIPGIGHNLRRHSHVLVRGGGARDLPGVFTSVIRGVYDLLPTKYRRWKRSKYGIKKK